MIENIQIRSGAHSADRNHREMTGGTMTLLKTAHSAEGISLTQFLLPAIDLKESHIPHVDAGLHTLEHMLAYSQDTGSLRSVVERLTGSKELGMCIIDISPYRVDEGRYAFRVSSVTPFDTELLTQAYSESLSRGRTYIELGGEAPFSTAKQCGQYDLHDTSAALAIIHTAQKALLRGESATNMTIERPTASTITVADLRLVRPKRDGDHSQRTLRPDASYGISQTLELVASLALPTAPERRLAFGTYGCMTGDYAMMLDTPMDAAHVAITRTLIQLAQLAHSENQAMRFIGEDAQFCLDHIRKYAPDIYAQAMDLGEIGFDTQAALEEVHIGRSIRRKPRTN